MIAATQIKRGMTIKLHGELYRVFSFQHITPGNWRGMVQTKLKSIKSGSIIEHRFRSEDRIEQAYLETHEMEYLYSDGSDFYFVHSYAGALVGDDLGDLVVAETTHGAAFVSAVARGRLLGVQFHPERSGGNGLRLLENFVALVNADTADTADSAAVPA